MTRKDKQPHEPFLARRHTTRESKLTYDSYPRRASQRGRPNTSATPFLPVVTVLADPALCCTDRNGALSRLPGLYDDPRAGRAHTVPLDPVHLGPRPTKNGPPDQQNPGTGPGTEPKPQPEATPLEIYPDIESQERVNILFLGIDQRPGEPIACRTDTMILVSINPKDMSASLLSIPRDLWVPIRHPKHPEDRINTAHLWGEIENYPGGGPELAKDTVQYNFGVPVHYYTRLNFTGFEQIIDRIGGIEVDVPDDHPRYQIPGARQQLYDLSHRRRTPVPRRRDGT